MADIKTGGYLGCLVVIQQEGKGPARDVIATERAQAFEALVSVAKTEHPDLNWDGAFQVRAKVCELKHVQLDEFPLNAPSRR